MEETLPNRSTSACCSSTGHFHVAPLQTPTGHTPCHRASSQNQGLSVARYPPSAAGGGGVTAGLTGTDPTTNQFGSNEEHSSSSTMSLSRNIRCSAHFSECIAQADKVAVTRPQSLHTHGDRRRVSFPTDPIENNWLNCLSN